MTEWASMGGVLDPSSQVELTSKAMMDVMKEKYSEPTHTAKRDFVLLHTSVSL